MKSSCMLPPLKALPFISVSPSKRWLSFWLAMAPSKGFFHVERCYYAVSYDFAYIFLPTVACVAPEKSVPGGGPLAPTTKVVVKCWNRLFFTWYI